MSKSDELKKCPFCAGTASAWCNGKGVQGKGYWITIKCDICGVSMLGGVSRNLDDPFKDSAYEVAKTRWNNRVNEEENNNGNENEQ